MKFSELWLREWVNPTLSTKDIASQLTMAGLEVDSVSPVAGQFDKVIVAEVTETKPHPQADRLTLCTVNTGAKEPLQIVCGASNVRSGLKVALAQIGAHLPGDFIIKETKLRGELSQGMLCSYSELGMAEQSEGIIELDDAAPVGMNIREWLQLDDQVFDIDLTPNRADCLSLLGIARELAALNTIPYQSLPQEKVSPDIDDSLSITIQSPKDCPRYCGRVIKGINNQANLPIWMVEKLRRSSIRLIHPVVDICNYVMLETGQPLHAFDLQKIHSGIVVRKAKAGETLTLLDNQAITLKGFELVIADKNKPLALAGIMGGLDSAVSEDTVDIFLESAFFSPFDMAGVARKHGLFTDASQRFERGVDPAMAMQALERTSFLIKTIIGGKFGPIEQVESLDQLPKTITIQFDMQKVKKLTGVSISIPAMQAILENLGMQVKMVSEQECLVTVPSWRFDLQQSVDLVEEIIRVHGYNQLEPKASLGLMQRGQFQGYEAFIQRLAHWFAHRGYHETISYSFVDPLLQDSLYNQTAALQLLNPVSSELSHMRVGLWPGLIASMLYNLHRKHTSMRIFEIGVVFDSSGKNLVERPSIAGLLTGEKGNLNWCEKSASYDFFDAKGDLEALFRRLHVTNVTFIQAEHPALHPGQSAQIVMQEKLVGWVGVLHPRIAAQLGTTESVILFELDLEPLSYKPSIKSKSLSKYPQIRRDLSFLVDVSVEASRIEAAVRHAANPTWLKTFEIFDVYIGKGIPEGKKSIAIAMIFQNPEKTWVDAEINAEISAIIKELEQEFSITLRE